MLEAVVKNWWVLLVRGLGAIAFGILTFVWPGVTLLVLVFLFGAHALIDGVAAIALGFGTRAYAESWWAMILVGALGILAGVGTFIWPGITAAVLLAIIAGWAILRGVFEIVAAIRLRKVIDNEWMLGLAGGCSVLFGVLLVAWPAEGLLTLLWLVGAGSILFGILCVSLSLRLRGVWERIKHLSPPPGAAAAGS